jgi:hypothetical protein
VKFSLVGLLPLAIALQLFQNSGLPAQKRVEEVGYYEL